MKKTCKRIRDFLRCKNGSAEIIACIVLVAIAIILGIAFREQLSDLLSNIWGAIRGRERELIADLEL